MPLLTDIDTCLEVLADDGLILLPTLSTWSIVCDSQNRVATERLLRIMRKADPPSEPEVLVDSIRMLKHIVPNLHPRLETLLAYHRRPLTVLFQQYRGLPATIAGEQGSVAVRLVLSPYGRELIGQLGRPLFGLFASLREGEYPESFGSISSAIIEQVDYVSQYGRDLTTSGPPVMVMLSGEEELVFLRE